MLTSEQSNAKQELSSRWDRRPFTIQILNSI